MTTHNKKNIPGSMAWIDAWYIKMDQKRRLYEFIEKHESSPTKYPLNTTHSTADPSSL
jgi:hypothetical protein